MTTVVKAKIADHAKTTPVYKLTLPQRVLVILTVVLSTTIYAGVRADLLGLAAAAAGCAVGHPGRGVLGDDLQHRRHRGGDADDRLARRPLRPAPDHDLVPRWCSRIATFMCGASNSLEELIVWRIVQGAAGAPLVPLGQTILLDSLPRRQQATVMSIFGMANMIGPSLGPMFAGQIAETLGWRWGFWMILPVAVASVIGNWFVLPRTEGKRERTRLDWLGFISLSAGIAAAQLVFSRGQRLDWFDSTEIVIATFVGCLMLYVFCVHSLTTERPFVRLRLLADRNYALGLILVTLFGMLNFALIVLLPPLLQQHAGYPEVGHRRDHRRTRARLGHRLLCGDADGAPRSAHQPVDRRAAAGHDRLVADGLRPQRRHDHADAVQRPAGRVDRRVVGAAHGHHLLDAVARVSRRGVPSPPQRSRSYRQHHRGNNGRSKQTARSR